METVDALKAAAFGTLLAVPSTVALACGDSLGAGVQRAAGDTMQVAWRSTPQPIPVSRHFVLDVELCPKSGQALPAELRVDATMPEHRHGMNYRPSVVAVGGGRWHVEGLLFHMPGRWELVFEWREAAGATRRLAQRVDVQ